MLNKKGQPKPPFLCTCLCVDLINPCRMYISYDHKTQSKKIIEMEFYIKRGAIPMSIIYVAIRQLALMCFQNHNQQRVPICHIFDYIWILLNSKNPSGYRRVLVWALRDSNPGPIDYESTALTNWAKGPKYQMCLICDQGREHNHGINLFQTW